MNFKLKHRFLFFAFALFFVLNSCAGTRKIPDFSQYSSRISDREEISENFYSVGDDKLIQNKYGIWELYVEGNPLERGEANGKLTKELMYKQEEAFVTKIKELVPSEFKQNLLRNFLKYFNRKLPDYVKEEYKAEIYGLSRSTSHDFDFVAPVYWRTLYFHAAHDIGHAVQDLAMVGCTSFAAWGKHTPDGKLLLGRNFDFYINEEFSENKIIAFINPDKGYKHAIVTWPGMIGAVSGMNEKGVTVTINAGKSSVPLKAKTPISLVTREILQYASNIDEAIEIAKSCEVFVSESIMVGSAEDGFAVLIEVSPKKFGVYNVESSSDLLVCSNHFQSEIYAADKKNQKAIKESHSMYRFERMNELVQNNPPVTPEIAADFLRNKEGLENKKIGYGNEKSINQLLSHHAMIFKPDERLMWVSANPYQLGAFVAYDLDEVFEKMKNLKQNETVSIDTLTILEDEFVDSQEFKDYEKFKRELKFFHNQIESNAKISDDYLTNFIELNPNYWLAYYEVGEYYFAKNEFQKAIENYKIALTKEVTTLPDKTKIEERIKKCERKLK